MNTSRTGNLASVKAQIEEHRLKPFATMLDAAGATLTAYDVPKNAAGWLVVVDPGGKIAFNASQGWRFEGRNGAPGRFCHELIIEEQAAKSPGILGIANLPPTFATAAHYFDLQQFPLLDSELKRLQKSAPGDAASTQAVTAFRERVSASRAARVDRIRTASASDPVQAYREAIAFVTAFADAPERAEVNELGKKLLKEKAVKRELAAETAYRDILVPIMTKTSTAAAFDAKLKPVLAEYTKAFADTAYAKVAEAAVAAHGDAIRNPNQ